MKSLKWFKVQPEVRKRTSLVQVVGNFVELVHFAVCMVNNKLGPHLKIYLYIKIIQNKTSTR